MIKFLSTITGIGLSLLMSVAVSASPRMSESVALYGIALYSDISDFDYGIYRLPTAGGSNMVELVAADPDMDNLKGACAVGDKYYINTLSYFLGMPFINHIIYDLEKWEQIENVVDAESDMTTVATDMTYDATTDNIYGCFYDDEDGESFHLAIQDQATFKTTFIGNLEVSMNSIAAAPDGTLYGISHQGALYTIDKSTAKIDLIGYTGVYPQYMSSATFDQATGVMYWTVSDDYGGYLYTVDTLTGKATMVTDFYNSEEIVGLFIPTPKADPDAPAAVKDFTVSFDADNLFGSLSFMLPTLTFGGSEINGDISYAISRNSVIIEQGVAAPGACIAYNDEVPEAGNYNYTVVASIDGMEGPRATIEIWIGSDTPLAPRSVALSYADRAFNLQWEPVSQSVHGGYLNGDISYKVTLYADDDVLVQADGIDVNEWAYTTDYSSDFTIYTATVEAYTEKTISAKGVSNRLPLGALTPPFFQDFDNVDSLTGYGFIDANRDGQTWSYDGSGMMYVYYNSDMKMDDWFITPAVKLLAGHQYHFLLGAKSESDDFPEAIEVYMGSSPSASAFTHMVIPKTTLYAEMHKFSADFVPPADGEYYFGLHGISDADMYILSVDYLGVTQGLALEAPAACTDVRVIADPLGGMSTTISYVAPVKSIDGEDVQVTRVDIYRDGVLIDSNDDTSAGDGYTFTDDSLTESGYYTYTITPYNTAGEGESTEVKVFVGIGIPAPPVNINVIERGDTGEVQISWEPSGTDAEGNYIDPSNLTYTVVDGEGNTIVEGITDTDITCKNIVDGQAFVFYGVYAASVTGVSSMAESPIVAIGKPLDMPIAESFDDGGVTLPLAIDQSGGGVWSVIEDNMVIGMTDADGTNGMLLMQVEFKHQYAEVSTGKIRLDAEVPVLYMSTFCLDNYDINYVDIMVRDCESGIVDKVSVVYPGKGIHREWNEVAIDLSAYSGKTVMIILRGVAESNGYLFIDNIRISQPFDIDLSVENIVAPASVKSGVDFDVQALVANIGAKPVSSYDVQLLLNGAVVSTVSCGKIEPFERQTVNMSYCFSPVAVDDNVLSVRVVCQGDADLDNNLSSESPIAVIVPKYPTASALLAVKQDGVNLSWQAPDLSDLGLVTVTEDFESYQPFSYSNIGDWTLVDGDERAVGGLNGITIPGIVAGVTKAAYFVMNYVELDLNSSFEAHSGQQYMMSLYTGYPQSDWLITPELAGVAQTVSFFARSYTERYGLEEFEVYYSSTDQQIDSFTLIEHVEAPAQWTEYSYQLPEGAKYFAIVCVSTDRIAFMVDDVTYAPADAQLLDLKVLGYNIYRNGVKINGAPVPANSFVDADGGEGDVYMVTVVYAQGESAPSDPVTVEAAGIASADGANVEIYTAGNSIVVSGSDSTVSVYDAEGKMIYAASPKAFHQVRVPAQGVYMVRTGMLTKKVVAKW